VSEVDILNREEVILYEAQVPKAWQEENQAKQEARLKGLGG
jgi:hypothetical protein